MLSRVANTIFWMNRYLERAENYARFLDVNFNLSLELPPDVTEQWKPLVVITGDWHLYESKYKDVEKSKVIYFLGFDDKNPNSIYNSILNVRENARSVRPDITVEVWEQVNYLYYLVKEERDKKRWKKNDPRGFFSEIKKGIQLLFGILDATISRTDAYHFGKVGQYLERADKTSRVLDVKYYMLLPSSDKVGSSLDLIQWAAVLKSVSAYDMYKKQYGNLTISNIIEFLILDKKFPRSMFYCLTQAEKSLKSISGSSDSYANEAERKIGLLKAQLEFADVNEIIETGLNEYLDHFQSKLNEVSVAVFDSYFSVENIMNKSSI
jgi:uncharacterized alpha-E superfamily protein